jgi:hypothetical protein
MSLVHTFPSSAQAVFEAFFASAGHVVEPPQVSATSHSPAAMRQIVLAGTAEQVPTDPAFVHESHVPALHAVLQQTPSTQKALVHSLAPLQARPFDFLPVQTPPEQYWLEAQFVSSVQPPHIVPLQVLGEHDCVTAVGHVAELPVQFAARVATSLVQLADLHA